MTVCPVCKGRVSGDVEALVRHLRLSHIEGGSSLAQAVEQGNGDVAFKNAVLAALGSAFRVGS